MNMVGEEVLTVPEVARQLRVSELTIRNWLRSGRLRGFRPGGTKAGWRVRVSDLQAFVAQAEQESRSGSNDDAE